MIDNSLLDDIERSAAASPRLRMNHNIHERLDEPCQRLINVLLPGTKLDIHRHRHTAETYVVLRGCMDVIFHNADGTVQACHRLDPSQGNYGINIPAGQWHTVEVIRPTAIFEVKEGPYTPLSPDDILKS